MLFFFAPCFSILFLLEELWEPLGAFTLPHAEDFCIPLSYAPAKPDLLVLPQKSSTSPLLGVPFVAVAFSLNFLMFIDMSIVELPGHMQLSFRDTGKDKQLPSLLCPCCWGNTVSGVIPTDGMGLL